MFEKTFKSINPYMAFKKVSLGSMGGKALVLCLTLGLAAGCVEKIRNHGYTPSESALSQLSVGQDTAETVIEKIGDPVSYGVDQKTSFYYISSKFSHFGALAPKEIERQIVAISFNAKGVLRNVERFGLEDGKVVAISRRVTDDNIQDVQFLSQLFGSFGAGSAADFLANR